MIKASGEGALYDKEISFTKPLWCLPVELEQQVLQNKVDLKDLAVNRWKGLVVPSAHGHIVTWEIMNYFFRNSTLSNEDNSEGFLFKCIGFHQAMVPAPFKSPSMTEKWAKEESIRSHCYLFDTKAPHTKTFAAIIDEIKVGEVLSKEAIHGLKSSLKQTLESVYNMTKLVDE